MTPKTFKEAQAYKYNPTIFNPRGYEWRAGDCVHPLMSGYQCTRRFGHGPAGLYCKQHARMVKGE